MKVKNKYPYGKPFGWFVDRDPVLDRKVYTILEGPYGDYIAHVNSHGTMTEQSLRSCRFCQVLKREEIKNGQN